MAEDFAYLLTRQVVACLALSSGYHRAESPTLDILSDVIRSSIRSLGTIAKENATLSGRSLVNSLDILQAIEEMNTPQKVDWKSLQNFTFKNATNIRDPIQRIDEFPLEIPSFPIQGNTNVISKNFKDGRNSNNNEEDFSGIIIEDDYINININKNSIYQLERQLAQLRKRNEKQKEIHHINNSANSTHDGSSIGKQSMMINRITGGGSIVPKSKKPSYIPSFLPDFPPDHCCHSSFPEMNKQEGLVEEYAKDLEANKNIERTVLRTKEIEEQFIENQNRKQEKEERLTMDTERNTQENNTFLTGQKRKLENSTVERNIEEVSTGERVTQQASNEKKGDDSGASGGVGRKRIKLISSKQSREQFNK